MQNTYAGDMGDFGKIALLREIQKQGLSIGVNWYLVEPVASVNKSAVHNHRDGKYLSTQFRECDETLSDVLTTIATSEERSVAAIEKAHLIPGARYFSEPVTVACRTDWHRSAMEALSGVNVVFLDPDNGMLPPGYFIETLEHFHLIHLVDEFVVKKVCQDYRRLEDAGEPLVPISVNISRLDFEVCDVFKMLSDFCEIYDVPRNMIDVEITESAFSDNTGLIKDASKQIRDAGYQIWIDDFGSGYSSLTTLADFQFDVLKLDMVFLRSADQNPRTKTLMTYIIKTASELGVSSLCEGVESEAHYQYLKETGCERAQGYFFGKPMPLDELLDDLYKKGVKWETR